jgi:hypothetical protein
MGAEFEFSFIKNDFSFFDHFCLRLTSKLAKSATNRTQQIFFSYFF